LGARSAAAAGRDEPASRRRDPLLRRALSSMSGLARWEKRWPALAGTNLPPAPDAPALEDVDAVSGALMLLRTDLYRKLGGFDEAYFLHCEDLDLCRRVRDAGLRVACANTVAVRHGKGTSSRRRPFFVARHKHRGMWRWFVKFDPAARNVLTRALVWCGLWTHYALAAPRYAWALLRAR
jgi:GT2 family glycosyltransferase